jgi:hypothetical protein
MSNMASTIEDSVTDLPIENCESKELGLHSLVAGTSDELEIGERIDEHIGLRLRAAQGLGRSGRRGYGHQWVRICPAVSLSDATIFLWPCPPSA